MEQPWECEYSRIGGTSEPSSQLLPGLKQWLCLHAAPAVVPASPARCRLEAHFLPGVLPDVGDEEISREPIERETPRVSESERPDFGPRRGIGGERVVEGNGVGKPLVDVDAEDLSQEGDPALRPIPRISGGAPVAEPDPQLPIGTERELSPVVIRVWLIDGEERDCGGGIGDVAIRRYREPQDLRVPGEIREVDVEESVVLVVGVEREAEETLLASRGYGGGEVEKRNGENLESVEHQNRSSLLREEQTPAPVSRVGHDDRPFEPLDHGPKGHGSGCGEPYESGDENRHASRIAQERERFKR